MTLSRTLKRWQKRLRALVHTSVVDQELNEEIAHHLELETQKNIALGMAPNEAARQARVTFGSAEQHRIATREARFGSWLPDMSLDFKLGGRMLIKHPALTIIATIAVAYAIAVGTAGFEIARQALWPTIPLPEGNNIVALQNWNVVENEPMNASPRDYAMWREGFNTISDLSVVDIDERSVAIDANISSETVASVSASMFTLTRVSAFMGRTLQASDEQGNAPDVVVVGYDFWKNKMNSATDAVGRMLRISGTAFTIVGVMPQGYGFPHANGLWRPLHLERVPQASSRLKYVFGRIAPEHSQSEATAQASVVGARAAATFPETHKNVRLRVVTLNDAVVQLPTDLVIAVASLNVFLVLLAALLCGNVAMLLFARAVSRERELLVRAALGASRGRLILQLFAEALLLSTVGAGVGLLVARFVLARFWIMIQAQTGPLPFWVNTSVSSTAILYAVLLTFFAASIAGVVPALKVTSGGAGARLRAASGGSGGLQFGGVWTVVIVAQIAFTTLLPWPLLGVAGNFGSETPAGFKAESFLTATLAMDRFDGVESDDDTVAEARALRLESRYNALADRLRQDPGVLNVTYADQMPQFTRGRNLIAMDAGPVAEQHKSCPEGWHCVGRISGDPQFFDAVEAPVLRGRALTAADAEQRSRVVLVNETFVRDILRGSNPIGRRIRFYSKEAPTEESWYEIVGVAPDLSVSEGGGGYGRTRIYEARAPRALGPLRVAIHTRGDPQQFVGRLREIAQATDPALRVIDPMPLTSVQDHDSPAGSFGLRILVSLTLVTLMLSLAGVYAVTSFAVARRTREIGVRVALGARPLHVLMIVFKRPLIQMTAGITVGAILGFAMANDDLAKVHLDILGQAMLFVLATTVCCAVACFVPTRRALGVQPVEALREE
ncbi:MAG: ABC transporter permease [Gemmatimonas sp.]